MSKIYLAIFATIFICYFHASGQSGSGGNLFVDYQPDNTIAPQIRGNNLNVSHSRGIANINYPLFTLPTHDKLSASVLLHHSTSGLKVNAQETVVGLGWSLSSLGSITRVMRDLPDEDPTYGYIGADIGKEIAALENGILVDDEPSNPALGFPEGYSDVIEEYIAKDTKPDYFVFEFFGRSGKIILNENGYPVVIPRRNFKIEPAFGPYADQASTSSSTRWVITDDYGYQFYFEQEESSTFSSEQFSEEDNVAKNNPVTYWEEVTGTATVPINFEAVGTTQTYTSRWRLTKVYNYNKELLLEVDYLQGQSSERVSYSEYLKAYYRGSVITDQDKSLYQINKTNTSSSVSLVDQVKSAAGTMQFNYTTLAGNDILQQVQLKDINDVVKQTINLDYTVLTNQYDDKVFLEKIERNGEPERLFEYYNVGPGLWNSRNFPNTPYVDVWGYFKSDPTREYFSKLPRETGFNDDPIGGPNNIFAPILASATDGALKTITNELGATTTFTYELNEISPYVIGGLRLREILIDNEGKLTKRAFTYEPFQAEGNYLSNKTVESICGLSNLGQANKCTAAQEVNTDCNSRSNLWQTEHYYHIQSSFNNLYPKLYYKSSQEIVTDRAETKTFAKTKYQYGEQDVLTRNEMSDAFDIKRNRPVLTERYDGAQVISDSRTTYQVRSLSKVIKELDIDRQTTITYDLSVEKVCRIGGQVTSDRVLSYIQTPFEITTSYYLPVEMIDRDVEFIRTTTTTYNYNVFGQVAERTVTSSSGEQQTMKYYYPTDFSANAILNQVEYIEQFDETHPIGKLKYCLYFNAANTLINNYNWDAYSYDAQYAADNDLQDIDRFNQCDCYNFTTMSQLQSYGGVPSTDSFSEAIFSMQNNRILTTPLQVEVYRDNKLLGSSINEWKLLKETSDNFLEGNLYKSEQLTHKNANNRGTNNKLITLNKVGSSYTTSYENDFITDLTVKPILKSHDDGSQYLYMAEQVGLSGLTASNESQINGIYPKVTVVRDKDILDDENDYYFFNFEDDQDLIPFSGSAFIYGINFSGKSGLAFNASSSPVRLKLYHKSYAQKQYQISFWANVSTTNNMTVNIGSQTVTLKKEASSREMSLWRGTFDLPAGNKGDFSEIILNFSSVIIDNLLILPSKAELSSFTYDPFVGITSSTDKFQNTVFYEYDENNRLKLVRDVNNDIIEKYTYNKKDIEAK